MLLKWNNTNYAFNNIKNYRNIVIIIINFPETIKYYFIDTGINNISIKI